MGNEKKPTPPPPRPSSERVEIKPIHSAPHMEEPQKRMPFITEGILPQNKPDND